MSSKDSVKKLKASKDWDKWIILVRTVAGDVWKYIDPSKLEQPIQPVRPSFPLAINTTRLAPKPVTTQTSTDGSNTPESIPLPDDIQYEKITVKTIDPYELEHYKDQTRQFEAMEKKLHEVRVWIGSNVAEEHIRKLKEDHTVWKLLKTLKERFKPTDETRELEVLRTYNKAKSYSKDIKLSEWIDRYEVAYEDAVDIKLPDVTLGRAERDLLLAIKPIDPSFHAAGMQKIADCKEAKQPIPEFKSLLNRFRSQMRTEEALTGRYHKIALAVWSGMDEDNDQERDKEDHDNKSRDKGPRSKSRNIKPCICGQPHALAKCYNLNPKIRPEGWQVRDAARDKINKAIKSNKRLLTQVLKLGYEYYEAKDSKEDKSSSKDANETSTKTLDGTYCSELITGDTETPPVEYNNAAVSMSRLRHYFTTDSASDIHIVNKYQLKCYTKTRDADETLNAGAAAFKIMSWGLANVEVIRDDGTSGLIQLTNVAYIPNFLTNIIALQKLANKDTHWSTEQPEWLNVKELGVKYLLKQIGSHWVLKQPKTTHDGAPEVEINDESEPEHSSFATKSNANGRIIRTAAEMHDIMAHAGPEVIKRIQQASADIEIDYTQPCPKTVDCDICGISKQTKVLSNITEVEFEGDSEVPFSRIAWDLIPMGTAYNGDRWISHAWCRDRKYHIVRTHRRKSQALDYLKDIILYIENVLKGKVQFIRLDGERTLGQAFLDFCGERGIQIERVAAPDSPEQNFAEPGGKILTLKARTLRLAAGLPYDMWPEVYTATAWIENRTPIKSLGYITPFQAVTGKRPRLAYLKKYGCKAFALAKGTMKPARLDRLDPRANIGYLVGWDSTNIYRVWVPSKSQVIRTRDVSFSNDRYKPGDIDVGAIMQEEAEQLIEAIEAPEQEEALEYDEIQTFPVTRQNPIQIRNFQDSTITHPPVRNNQETINSDSEYVPGSDTDDVSDTESDSGYTETSAKTSNKSHDHPVSQQSESISDFPPTQDINPQPVLGAGLSFSVPGRDFTTDNSLKRSRDETSEIDENDIPTSDGVFDEGNKRFRAESYDPGDEVDMLATFCSAFAASLSLNNQAKLHRDKLPDPPTNWKEVLKHPRSTQFIIAAKKEIEGLVGKDAIQFVPKDPTNKEQEKLLPLKWVFTYKFDADGYLLREKARLVARGDLQMSLEETYAATLAAESFRAIIAMMNYFDLESRQYDCHLAYLNADLRKPIYARSPPGFDDKNDALKVLKALYGLKESGRLWSQLFVETLEELGLKPVPGVKCMYSNGWMLLVFYVDDIFTVFPKHKESQFLRFEKALLSRFTVNYLGEGSHFLGVRIIRDRPNKKTYLVQDSYASKLEHKFNIVLPKRIPKTPLPSEPLVPFKGQATKAQIKGYQQKVGSLNYAAVYTRGDMAFAVSKLSQFLTNPGPLHHAAADHALLYFIGTKHLAQEFDGDESNKELFTSYSDAAYADNKDTRWSSFGIVFKLFGGVISYKASKQKTVTTSSTEAELLALAATARAYLYWLRFFKNIKLDLQQDCKIYCDNTQTIRLCSKESDRLETKLRHVDIHSCWLRQEVQKGTIKLEYIATNDMVADGLTKSLTPQKHAEFIKQLNMVDIKHLIEPLN